MERGGLDFKRLTNYLEFNTENYKVRNEISFNR